MKPDDVAWIDPTQGQFAPVENTNAGKEKNLQGWNVNDRIGAVKYALKDMTEDETAALLQYKSSASYKVNVKLRVKFASNSNGRKDGGGSGQRTGETTQGQRYRIPHAEFRRCF